MHSPAFSVVLLAGALGTCGASTAASKLLAQGIEALGGFSQLSQVSGVSYVGGDIFRTKGVMQTYSLGGMDVPVAATGSQNVTFSYDGNDLRQRIDVRHKLGSYWTFARPLLEDVVYSMVVHGGKKGFAAIVEGSYSIWLPDAPSQGNLDGLLAAFLINEAHKLSPLLLLQILSNQNFTLRSEVVLTGQKLPAVHDRNLGLSVVFDIESYLPYIVRSTTNHSIFGSSTYDLLLTDYISVEGILFPTRIKTILNRRRLLGDYRVEHIVVNPTIDGTTFQGPGNVSESHLPRRSPEYGFAEISEWSTGYMWYGEWERALLNFTITQPFDDLPGLWHLDPGEVPSAYKQSILEFEHGVVVLDAPPHQSLLIIEWIRKDLRKPITHVWPSHHHHDHATGLKDYVNIGAKIIVLDEAKSYYQNISGVEFATFTTDVPFVLKDRKMHAKFIHMAESFHAFDQSYVVVTPACITENSTMAIFDADHVTPAIFNQIEQAAPMELLDRVAHDRISDDAVLISAHEAIMPIKALHNVTGYLAPGYSNLDFRFGSSDCE
ncbi:hypothetical protein B0J13DRAFT_598944 [Dactylonectria estremocensis]|uniref:Metallo-beta-lactamase domain-containing protein n=1 Tax=Dactylonectria estremocensis TaxID=1079267 RepID=A0A9P9DT99_9HYPO|nr:hypothetical protein B0J13DRAFT_598944 [Dactylonectria estremocensis]